MVAADYEEMDAQVRGVVSGSGTWYEVKRRVQVFIKRWELDQCALTYVACTAEAASLTSCNFFYRIGTPEGRASLGLDGQGVRWLVRLPLVTACVVALVLITWQNVLDFVDSPLLFNLMCLSPHHVFAQLQFHRLFVYLFNHSTTSHYLAMLITFIPLARSLEHSLGSIRFANILLVLGLWNIVSGLLLSMMLHSFYGDPPASENEDGEYYEHTSYCQLGLSGLNMALLAVETSLNYGRYTRRLCDTPFTMPAWSYPAAMCITISTGTPNRLQPWNVSGLLGGIALGMMFDQDELRWVVLSTDKVEAIQDTWYYVFMERACPLAIPRYSEPKPAPNNTEALAKESAEKLELHRLRDALHRPMTIVWDHQQPKPPSPFIADSRPSSVSDIMRQRNKGYEKPIHEPLPAVQDPQWHKPDGMKNTVELQPIPNNVPQTTADQRRQRADAEHIAQRNARIIQHEYFRRTMLEEP